MKVEIDYKFGQSVYLRNDPEQLEYLINRIIIEPKARLCFELLGPDGEFSEIPELLISKERDMLKVAGIEKDNDE